MTTQQLEKGIVEALKSYPYGTSSRYLMSDIGAETDYRQFCKAIGNLIELGIVTFDDDTHGYTLARIQ